MASHCLPVPPAQNTDHHSVFSPGALLRSHSAVMDGICVFTAVMVVRAGLGTWDLLRGWLPASSKFFPYSLILHMDILVAQNSLELIDSYQQSD